MVMAKSWVKELELFSQKRENLPPDFDKEEWFTVKQAMKEFGVGDNRARAIISEGLDRGRVEVFRGSIWSKEKHQLIRQVWYKFKNPK